MTASCGSKAATSSACGRAQIWRLGVGRTFQITATFASLSACARTCRWRSTRTPAACARCWRASARAFRDRGRRAARSGRHARPGRADLRRAGLWRPEARRARHRAGQPAAPAADGRADRRHGAEGTRRADGADGAAGAGAQHRRAVHRARHGRGLHPGRPHHRARPRRADRRRHACRKCAPIRNVRAVYLGSAH